MHAKTKDFSGTIFCSRLKGVIIIDHGVYKCSVRAALKLKEPDVKHGSSHR